MRRWLRAAALGLVAGLALTGCGGPAGSDGDLTDDWPAVAAPAPFVPASGVCHPARVSVGYLSSYGPVPCDQWHSAETVHVGTLPAEHTDRSTPPPAGSPARQVAYTECEKAANRALGADWHSGRIRLSVVLPSGYGWRGGARWFRCDVSEIYGLNNTAAKPRTASLKGSLTGPAPLATAASSAPSPAVGSPPWIRSAAPRGTTRSSSARTRTPAPATPRWSPSGNGSVSGASH
ncbi:hypothetical protein Misp04_62040 [Micromonospora sp. NBRC 101691]|nr:hypothetical protein Misp04_62040 [Micromonospora sp. NBRC 101691]